VRWEIVASLDLRAVVVRACTMVEKACLLLALHIIYGKH
jgi:hypothetical protein